MLDGRNPRVVGLQWSTWGGIAALLAASVLVNSQLRDAHMATTLDVAHRPVLAALARNQRHIGSVRAVMLGIRTGLDTTGALMTTIEAGLSDRSGWRKHTSDQLDALQHQVAALADCCGCKRRAWASPH